MTLSLFCLGHAGHCAGLRRGLNLIILADRGTLEEGVPPAARSGATRQDVKLKQLVFSLSSRPRRRPGLTGCLQADQGQLLSPRLL
jgi:hypothetical protein